MDWAHHYTKFVEVFFHSLTFLQPDRGSLMTLTRGGDQPALSTPGIDLTSGEGEEADIKSPEVIDACSEPGCNAHYEPQGD